MYRLQFYILTLFVFISSAAYAGVDSVGSVRQNLENGLPSDNVYSILEDHNGYIWFATDNGVVKYNGYSYRVFNTNDGLPSSDVWKLYEDKYGRIWFFCYSNETGYIKDDICHKLKEKFPQIRPIFNIWEKNDQVIMEVPLNNMQALRIVDSQDVVNDIIIDKNHWPVINSVIDHNYIVNVNDVLYKVTTDGYKLKLDEVSSLTTYLNHAGPATTNFYLRNDIIVNIETGWSRIFRYNMRTFKVDTFHLKDFGGDEEEKIYTLDFIDTTVRIYTNKAIYSLGASFTFLQRQDLTHLVNNTVQVAHYYQDKTGNGWVSTNVDGSIMLPKFKLALKQDTLLNSMFRAKCVGVLRNGSQCWWSDLNKKLMIVDLQGDVVLSVFYTDRLQKVIDIGNSKLLLFFLHQVREYDMLTNEDRSFFDNRHVYLSGLVSTFEKMRYIGYDYQGEGRMYDSMAPHLFYDVISLAEYHPMKFMFAGMRNVYNLQMADTVVSLKRVAEGRYPNSLVNAIPNTYVFYNKKNILLVDVNTFKTRLLGDRLLNLLHSNSILGIYTDRFSNIYLHLDNKLVVYNPQTRWSDEIPVNLRLTDAYVTVYKDKLLFSGNFGLAYIRIKGPMHFGDLHIAPNIKGTWYNRVYQMVVNDTGKINLVTDKGVYAYWIDSLLKPDYTYNGYKNDVIHLTLNTPYIRHIDPFDTVSIAPGLQSVAFDFINYYGSGNRYFVYKIDNVSDWQKTTTGEVLITDLKPDKEYVVRIYVVDEMWKSKPIAFYLYKQPHWYETGVWIRIFWVLAVLLTILVIGLIVLITRFYVNQANRKRSKLLDLELRAVYSQINPHFIFNTLSSALFFISKKELDEAYTHVSKFSKLLRSYLKSSQERYSSLSEEVEMLQNYIELQQTRFEKKFIFEINVENKIPADNIRIPSLLLQPLVENAINHGLFHKQGEGHLSINFLQGRSNNELICIIEDDGVGRLRASEINKESTVRHDSYGTKLTQKLIEIFKEYEHMNIYLEYIDKKAPDTGTIVKLTLRNLKYDA